MKLNQELCCEAEEVKISNLGVEGQIILLRQPGFPVLRQVREGHHIVLTWEESCTTEYVPQFTTSLGRSHIWRPIIAPIQHDGNVRRVRLQPYCHSRVFRLRPKPAGDRRSSTPGQPRSAGVWWRCWLPNAMARALSVAAMGVVCLGTAADPLDTWHARISPGGAFGNGTYVAVGTKGVILQSDAAVGGGSLRLLEPSSSRSGFAFKFTGEIGATYQIQRSDDLVNLTMIGTVKCDQSPMSCDHVEGNPAGNFYRVVNP